MNQNLRNSFLNLVKSLSIGEKRRIKRDTIIKKNQEPDFIILIDRVSKMKKWDENQIKSVIKSDRIDHTILYAVKKIFKSVQGDNKSQESNIYQAIWNLHICIQRQAGFFVKIYTDEVINIGLQNENYDLLVHSLNSTLEYFSRREINDTSEGIINEYSALKEQFIVEVNYQHNLQGLIKDYKLPSIKSFQIDGIHYHQTIGHLIRHKEFKKIKASSNSNRLKAETLAVEAYYEFLNKDYEKCLSLLNELITIYIGSKFLISENPKGFYDHLLLAISIAALNKKSKLVDELYGLIAEHKDISPKWRYYRLQAILNIYRSSQIDYGLRERLSKADIEISAIGELLSENESIKLFFSIFATYYHLGDYYHCIKWSNKLLEKKVDFQRIDLFLSAFIYKASSLYELGDWEALNNLVLQSKRIVSQVGSNYPITTQFLSLLGKLSNAPQNNHHKVILEDFQSVQSKIELGESKELLYFNYGDWYKNKIALK